ncbi:hypothetical protein KY334_03680 [Candidatus Woesearchaeota archaeon]|nr:hypothetical protein [Candidatus Woesearchaeota archaeon]
MAKNEFKLNASELKSRQVSESEVGYAIMCHVIANKSRNQRLYNKVYSAGPKKRFQNYESNSVLRALERLVNQEPILFQEESMEHIQNLKNEKVDFYHINFVYEGIMFLSLEKHMEVEEVGTLLGEKIYNNLTSRLPAGKSPYEVFLSSIITEIYNKYNINLR